MSLKPLTHFLMIGAGVVGLGVATYTTPQSLRVEAHQKTQPRLEIGKLAQTAPPQTPARELDVPYVPTPQTVVDEMLRMANITSQDVLYDLGSGDGRIVITAAQRYGTRGVGIDLDPRRVKEANQNARMAGATNLVEFRQQDLFQTDLSEATVVTLYLLPKINLQLRPKLLSELKPGTRIVSHAFSMGDWKPEKTAVVEGRMIYFWTVPPKSGNPGSVDRK